MHLLHLPHPSKLSWGRASFGRGCTFERSFLHRFCTFCTLCPVFGFHRRGQGGFGRRNGRGISANVAWRPITALAFNLNSAMKPWVMRDSARADASTSDRCLLGESMGKRIAVDGCSGQGWGLGGRGYRCRVDAMLITSRRANAGRGSLSCRRLSSRASSISMPTT